MKEMEEMQEMKEMKMIEVRSIAVKMEQMVLLIIWIMAIMAALTARMEEALSFRMMHCMGPFPATDGMEMAEMAECSLFQSMSLPSTVVVVNGHPEITFVRGLSIALCEVRG